MDVNSIFVKIYSLTTFFFGANQIYLCRTMTEKIQTIEFHLDLFKAQPGEDLMSGDIGYDEYAGTLSSLGWANLSALKQAPRGTFRYVRIHNIFTSKEGDGRGARDAGGDPVRVQKNGTITYNWTIIDRVCQALLYVGCIPF